MSLETVVADSTVWIDFLGATRSPQVEWLRAHQANWDIRVIDLSVCEVLQGTRSDADFLQAQQILSFFGILSTGGANLAVKAARNYRALRSRGITVRKTIDCLIATYCIEQDLYLLHNDRDFNPFEQFLALKVIHPERSA